MTGDQSKAHAKAFLLLPFLHRAFERVFGPSEAVTVRVGQSIRRLVRIVGHVIPSVG